MKEMKEMIEFYSKEERVNKGLIKNFYEKYHAAPLMHPVEKMKQESRIQLLKEMLPEKRKKILVIGCGTGSELKIFQDSVVALDLSHTAIKKARNKRQDSQFVCGDGCNLPFKDRSFDCLVCSEVIEHVPDQKKMVSEFHRVLNEEGKLILTMPNWLSFYGLFRKIAEFLFNQPVTAGDQPIDNWFTPKTLGNLLKPYFDMIKIRGCWYYPPTGKGEKQLPPKIMLPLFELLEPIDRFLSKNAPSFGHIIGICAMKKKG